MRSIPSVLHRRPWLRSHSMLHRTDRIFVYFNKDDNVSTNDIKVYVKSMQEGNVQKAIIAYSGRILPLAKKYIEMMKEPIPGSHGGLVCARPAMHPQLHSWSRSTVTHSTVALGAVRSPKPDCARVCTSHVSRAPRLQTPCLITAAAAMA